MSRVGPINFLSMELSELKQRRGRFCLKDDLIDRDISFIQKVMSQVIITRCEYIWLSHAFSYDAISPLFDLCPDKEIPPNYVFSQDEGLDLVCTQIGIDLG